MAAAIPGDPLSSFVGSLGGGLGKGLGDAIGGGGGPLISGGGWDFRSNFDSSGWTVSTGSSKATGATTRGTDMSGRPQGNIGQTTDLATQAGMGWIGTLLIVGVAVYWISRGGKFLISVAPANPATQAQALALLARTLRHCVSGAVCTLDDLAAGCSLFTLHDGEQLVGAFAARGDTLGAGLVLSVTAAGGLPGYDLTAAMDGWMTLQAAAAGARRLECVTQRRGLIKKLKASGYHVAGVVMAKDF